MRVLVTGSGGFIGKNLLSHLSLREAVIEANALAGEALWMFEHRGEGHGPTRLDDEFGDFPESAHGAHNVLFADGEHIVDVCLD